MRVNKLVRLSNNSLWHDLRLSATMYSLKCQFTLSSAWNQKEKTQPSFVVQEVVCGLRKESIELETFQQAFNLWLWTVVVYQKVLTTGCAIFTDQCGSIGMFLVYLLYECKCLRIDLLKINRCLNVLFIIWFLYVLNLITFVLRNTQRNDSDGICLFADKQLKFMP